MTQLLHELIRDTAVAKPANEALRQRGESLCYAELDAAVHDCASGLVSTGLGRQRRVAVYLPKQVETVVAMFGAAAAGGIFVPVNPLLKPEQVGHILRDCDVEVLITAPARAAQLADTLAACPGLRQLVGVGGEIAAEGVPQHVDAITWQALCTAGDAEPHRVISTDVAAILYTSGSTGKPKGVVLSHGNMVTGAHSVASYLENTAEDRLLTVLPFSFDYGFSQLSTAFAVGACAVLMEYLMPRDVIRAVAREGVTALAGVPPLWNQLCRLEWPQEAVDSLRYFTNSGGAMPVATLAALRERLPNSAPYLMYGLTEAFRSTYLPPSEVDARPESMGKAIPNAEIMVVNAAGEPCAPDEPGELVHRGSLVALGYWNDPQKTAARFKPTPGQDSGLVLPEIAVWSGDTVRKDADGYLYFVGRRDEMIKTSGYRVSPTEVEEVLYASGIISETAALGLPDEEIGQRVVALVTRAPATPADDAEASAALLAHCRKHMPAFMVPAQFIWRDKLPRNPNGKIDRNRLSTEMLKDAS